ncbi:aldose epimerase family protein [Treponema sp. HNW]|uniref:aldose epimerase family protein n=1 Tax=Treponema sp. HNW TaxID=3116654 RepID=UPI003D0A6D23
MKIKKRRFGVLSDGTKLTLYTLSNTSMAFSVTDYGCIITSLFVPDKQGKLEDIVLGYSTIEGYINDTNTYFGSCVGRYANRIANARFSLNGTEYRLDANNGKNCLHGGFKGYNRTVWKSKAYRKPDEIGIRFSRTSHDGEQGFPGKLKIEVEYALTKTNELIFRYKAAAKKDTVVCLTNHSYYNLAGEGAPDILSHRMRINADSYLPVNSDLIPLKKTPVEKTPFDFRVFKTVGQDIKKAGGGYDHCFCIDKTDKLCTAGAAKGLLLCAEVEESVSGRTMSVYTDCPGVQFYTGNFLDVSSGKNGLPYKKHGAFCLETEAFPDSPNRSDFPSVVVKAGTVYESRTVHKFGLIGG